MKNILAKKTKYQSLNPVYFIRMMNEQTTFWHYAEIKKAKEPIFLKDYKSKESISIKDYGNIIESGWGLHVPKEIQEKYS